MPSAISRFGDSPRCADHLVHQGTGYFVEVPPDSSQDLSAQIVQTLASLDAELGNAGTERSRLLMVTIYLTDIGNIDVFNQHWDAWLGGAKPPVRACVEVSRLADPGYLLELAVTAAV